MQIPTTVTNSVVRTKARGMERLHGHGQRYHHQSAENDKFTLGEINDPRGVVNHVKSHGHHGVNTAPLDAHK